MVESHAALVSAATASSSSDPWPIVSVKGQLGNSQASYDVLEMNENGDNTV
jgi:hypothetical protein